MINRIELLRAPGIRQVHVWLGDRTLRQKHLFLAALALLLAAVAAAYLLLSDDTPGADNPCPASELLYWHDPMVPMERYPGPGKSSMNMELIPKCADESAAGVRVSPAMVQNLGIRTTPARMMDIAPVVVAVGRVEVDERLIAEVQTLTPGFVQTLAVRAEGEPVSRGSRIATVYSPELLGAQQEYAALVRIRGSAVTPGLREAARSRLRLLGLPAGAIQRLSSGGAPQRTYAVFAPVSGIVRDIGARPGAQVTPGQSIVTLADLSRVLVIAQIPEASLGNVGVGRLAEVTFPAYAGETFKGRVDYIFPSLDAESRTARARITLGNPGLRLKEGMFANVRILGTGGMALVVPSEAVIETGRRKVVLVRRNDAFLPIEVVTGREAGEMTEIVRGLERGAEVVVSGQFLIDSEASLTGMMQRLNANAPQQRQGQGLAVATGLIRTMDTDAGKVTIAHGPVPMMNWPPMTMTFSVQRPPMLRGFKAGSRVEFAFRKDGEAFVITSIKMAEKR